MMWEGNGNTIKLLFPLKGLEILHQERRGMHRRDGEESIQKHGGA